MANSGIHAFRGDFVGNNALQFRVRVLVAALSVVLLCITAGVARADGMVAKVTSAPIFPNGIVRDIRAGINIFLQSDAAQGDAFLNPDVVGYGIPAGGRMEVELISGYERDPGIPLDNRSILLVVGTPQQGLPASVSGLSVYEGSNQNTFVISSADGGELLPETLLSPAPGAAFDPIRQRGIKIIHIGRASAFISRGEKGVMEVRLYDGNDSVVASGRGEVQFLTEPRPQVFLNNIPHDQRNHNWQRVDTGKILGVASNTLPLPVILYERNDGLDKQGILNAGVLSIAQLVELNYNPPRGLRPFTDGLIIQDTDGNGLLHPELDTIVGGLSIETPHNATGYQILTPLVSEAPFLSVSTAQYNERAAVSIGGAIMQVVFIAGNLPGLYKPTFSLLKVPGDPDSGIGSSATYTIVVESGQ